MKKSLTILKICLYNILFIYFISCGHKAAQDTPQALVISKCSDVIVSGECDGRKIGAHDCQWNVNDGKCEDKKTPAENENNPPVDPPTDEEAREDENNPPAEEESAVADDTKPADEPVAEEENNPIKPTECSHYSVDNKNLEQCGLTKIPGKLCNVQRPKGGDPFECVEVAHCNKIIGNSDKAMLRCNIQDCHWRKEKILGKVIEMSKESCHKDP